MTSPGFFAAAAAGLLSFISPCVLPLVPAYLSYISGSTAAQLSSPDSKGRILVRSLAFSLGFTIAFTLLGVVFSGGAMFVGRSPFAQYIGIAGGILVVILGLNMVFDFLKFLGSDARLIGKFSGKEGKGFFGALALGFAFAAGWSPCIGPILASILLMASREGDAGKAALLLSAYSLGFALPFIASGLFFDRLRPLMRYLAKHGKTVRIVSGLVLVAFGAAMAAGSLGSLSALAAWAGYSLQDFIQAKPGAARLAGAGIWALAALAAALSGRSRPSQDLESQGLESQGRYSQGSGSPIPEAQASGRSRRKGRILAAAALGAAGLLEALGVFSILGLAAAWLTFAGI